jgi:hypothetical protein
MNKYLLLDEDTGSVIDSCEANCSAEATVYFYKIKGYRSGEVVDYDSAKNDSELTSFESQSLEY